MQKHSWIYDALFLIVMALAAWLRLTGADWGEGQHQHPDELFLTGVLDSLRAHTCQDATTPVDLCAPSDQRWLTVGEYFNTSSSTLNPYQRGYSFFVYGNLPITLTRILLELNDGQGNSKFFARQVSALMDLLTLLVLYLIVSKVYNRKTALLATAFSALAVMQIQQSHFFTSDLFVNFFMFLALYFAVKISGRWSLDTGSLPTGSLPTEYWLLTSSAAFGLALGMAMASKINAAALAIALPAALLIRYWDEIKAEWNNGLAAQNFPVGKYWQRILLALALGGLATLLSFRVFQPYAFDGLGLNPQWVNNIVEQRAQANGTADLPWNLQWARRTHLYSFTNLTVWGLGLPLGILAWAGFALMAWKIWRGERQHLLLWGWTAFYFGWQSLQFNPTMRYQLPIYPLLAMMAAWAVSEFRIQNSKFKIWNQLIPFAGILTLALTAVWAFAFQSIYLRAETRIAASRWIYANVPGPINLKMTQSGAAFTQPLAFPSDGYILSGAPYTTTFVARNSGDLTELVFERAVNASAVGTRMRVTVADDAAALQARGAAQIPPGGAESRGEQIRLPLSPPLRVEGGKLYTLTIESDSAPISLRGAGIANETDYDWSLPFRVDGYDPFGGLYPGDLNLQVYWDDNPDKLARFVDILSKTDYIFIPTNHQYAQITRLPERYPLTTEYYRLLLGCPQGEDIIRCYQRAEPGMYYGSLGFELVKTFTSYPTLGNLVINDQSAEEAFTFYDHPKVLIFKKTAAFNETSLRAQLGAVDLTRVVHLTPKEAGKYEAQKTLLLTEWQKQIQRAGGTWSQLFNDDWLQNKVPLLGAALWYLFIFLLGLAAYPLTRAALPGLGARAYPFSRTVGVLLFAWISWMGGSLGIQVSRGFLALAALILLLSGIALGWARRAELRAEWKANRKFFLTVEILFLAFFLIDLLIRFGNADLWHPSKGGERPMDFSYFNAVIKSSVFPPYDPWYAGGYINYYYYGFVLAGMPVKLLGIVPSIAYNFILPTWFALIAVNAFGIGCSLTKGKNFSASISQMAAGLSAALFTVLLGNLGALKLIFNGFQRIAAPGGIIPADANVFQKLGWLFTGLLQSFGGAALPIGRGDWYWFPSRVIPAPNDVEPITEFPLFTFLYSDMHAHMLVMPITLFIIAWAIAFIQSRAQLRRGEWLATFGISALAIGALRPINTWDLYTYFPLAALALIYTLTRYGKIGLQSLPTLEMQNQEILHSESLRSEILRSIWLKTALSLLAAGGLYLLSALLYAPFTYWYSQGYGQVMAWNGSHTPLSSYFTQWGLFLFIIIAWLAWETRQWMAATPVSHLEKLRAYVLPLEIAAAALLALLAYFAVKGAAVGWLALPLAAWAGALILRPDLDDSKRFALLMIGTALTLTAAVELIVLVGDIGRMNTVFKLYLQAWMLFAVSAAAAFGWLLTVFPFWTPRWRNIYQTGAAILIGGAFLFTLTGSMDKISDRMNPAAPRSLDSMNYMNYAEHWDGNTMQLSEDYRAIRWMQDNAAGSPVIVEANCTEYRWCTRFTIYTGLPGVVGWNWHQRQQRGHVSLDVQQRVDDIGSFYVTLDINNARMFLKKYEVAYIIVGQLERNVYPALDGVDGLSKFPAYNGIYWDAVYQDGATSIYKVR